MQFNQKGTQKSPLKTQEENFPGKTQIFEVWSNSDTTKILPSAAVAALAGASATTVTTAARHFQVREKTNTNTEQQKKKNELQQQTITH